MDALTANADGTRRAHIPFRDSKLTRLLQPSLGGNCKTSLLAMVAPTQAGAAESLRTLRFACRASFVQAAVQRNVTVTLADGTVIGGDIMDVDALKGPAEPSKPVGPQSDATRSLIEAAGGPDAPFFNCQIMIPTRAGE